MGAGNPVLVIQRFVVTGIIAAIIALLASLAPHDVHQPVPHNQITRAIPANAITGQPCGSFGPIVAAVLVNTIGYRTYQITCADGVEMLVSR